MRAQRCTAYLFLFLFLLTNLTNGEGTTPPRLFLTRFDVFRRERGGFNSLPPCFRHVSTQPERVQPLLVVSTRTGKGSTPHHSVSTWLDTNEEGVDPSSFVFDAF